MSSDATGELYVLARTSTGTAISSGATPSATKKSSAGRVGASGALVAVLLGAVLVVVML